MTSSSRSPRIWTDTAAAAGWLGPWLGVAGLGLWTASPGGAPLALAAVGVGLGALFSGGRGRTWSLGSLALILGILAGFVAHRQVRELRDDWPGYWDRRQAVVGERLSAELEALLEAGERAADELADLGSEPGAIPAPERLERLRRRHGVTALALYDLRGGLRVWDGDHRGRVPEEVQRGIRRYVYGDRPLFGYLYITAQAGGAGTAAAAFLLRSDLPGTLGIGADDFAATFHRRVGERIRIFPAPLAEGQGGWELEMGDRTLLSVVLDPPSPAERAAEILDRWRLVGTLSVLLAWLLLAAGGPARLASATVAALALVFLAGSLRVPEIAGSGALFDSGLFVLPGPLPVSLGRFTLLALAALSLVAVLPRPGFRLPPWAAGALAGLALPALLSWARAGVAEGALASGELGWITYQCAVAVLAVAVVASLVVFARHPAPRRRRGLSALAVAGGLAGLGGAWVWTSAAVPAWWPALWAVPVALAAGSAGAWPGWQRPVASWILAALVGASATLPPTWADRVQARMSVGEQRLQRLAAASDPELEVDLRRLGEAALLEDGRGSEGVELLYGALRASRFGDAGHPAWLTLWSSARVPVQEIRVGVGADRPAAADDAVSAPGAVDIEMLAYGRSDARYVLRVRLSAGRVLTVTAPPFSEAATRSPLSPLLSGMEGRGADPLTLIPLSPLDERAALPLRWVRLDSGWQAEMPVAYPQVLYDAHYQVELPGALLMVARASLLLTLNLMLVLGFWGIGRGLIREALPPELRLRGLVISFRARVTLALFGFFLLANAIFGTLAYRTIDGASHRAAEVLAERVAEEAAGWYFEESGAMELLARRVGTELLEYREGELREGSVEELVELGLYEGWIPFSTHTLLDGREGVREAVETSLGRWEYVTAYRRLPDGDVLGAPMPLQAGATALRSSDVLELLGFAVLVGGALSLVLALLVGRTLTRPIHALQVASERVGAGNLSLRLAADRTDEFGAVFRAFNRMVKRVRRARRQLLRTARRTEAIMEEAAVGMVALDPSGRVTLVNPRAEALLDTEVRLGRPIPTDGVLGLELTAWLGAYMHSGDEEGDLELHAGERRVRVRARRLVGERGLGGAVVALEDVTDELRTERVLAWGEMARQVAHEVKNPLTPMKLSIQHILRARADDHGDFDEILTRNAEAMLSEIDRLAGIAQSFSRFGAPGGEGGTIALAAVDVGSVVREVLALYSASEEPVRFLNEVDAATPPVEARVSEMKEVLVNLLENAREALREGGTVRVMAHDERPEGVLLEVVDDGDGIPEELMPHVFEPHFSTRSGGTGLGLAIVRRLVDSWGGRIEVQSVRGRGTRVTLRLRRWGQTAEPEAGEGP